MTGSDGGEEGRGTGRTLLGIITRHFGFTDRAKAARALCNGDSDAGLSDADSFHAPTFPMLARRLFVLAFVYFAHRA